MGTREPNKQKKILILSFSDLSRDPRVYRQLVFIAERYEVVSAGFGEINESNILHVNIEKPSNRLLRDKIPIALLMFLKFFETCYWNFPVIKNGLKALDQLNDQSFDLIIANDLMSLPIAIRKANHWNTKVLLDAHEYTPRQYDDQSINKLFFPKFWDYICKKYLSKADGMITVGPGIAREYNKNYGINCDIITNAPFYDELEPTSVDEKRIKIIHHGVLDESRGSEYMILLMNHLNDHFCIDFMVVNNNGKYLKKIKDMARDNPRIRFIDPVPMPFIAEKLNNYDVGLYMLKPSTFNTYMALPNKIFEFIQARLAIAIWPSPEMANIVNEYNCGIVSEDFTIESMARKLNALSTDDIVKYKMNSHKAADFLCAERNRDKLLTVVESLIGS
jgi:glycosyltransferase involved in cell wall biosynthesis